MENKKIRQPSQRTGSSKTNKALYANLPARVDVDSSSVAGSTLSSHRGRSSSTSKYSIESEERRKKNQAERLIPEPFQGQRISRKEIIRRSCSDSAENSLSRLTNTLKRWQRSSMIQHSSRTEEVDRPSTLPSIVKRRGKVSRQEILQRRASLEAATRKSYSEEDGRLRSKYLEQERLLLNGDCRSVCEFSVHPSGALGLVPRPSTLPKLATQLKKKESDSRVYYKSANQDATVNKDAPVYGRIKRRKLSLSNVTERNTSGTLARRWNSERASRTDVSRSYLSLPKRGVRTIRDPVPDPVPISPRPRSLPDKSWNRTEVSVVQDRFGNDLRVCESGLYRTMSRRRILNNAEEAWYSNGLKELGAGRHTLPTLVSRRCRNDVKIETMSGTAVIRRDAESGYERQTSASTMPTRPERSRKPSMIPLRINGTKKVDVTAQKWTASYDRKTRSSTSRVPLNESSNRYSIFGLCTNKRIAKKSQGNVNFWEKRPIRRVGMRF